MIVICVEVTADHNLFNGWHCSSGHVVDVREELSNRDFTDRPAGAELSSGGAFLFKISLVNPITGPLPH